jgi:hypothetical protein
MFVLASGLYLVAVGCACALPVSLAFLHPLPRVTVYSVVLCSHAYANGFGITDSSKQIQSGMKALTTPPNPESAPLRHRCSSTVRVEAGV